MNWINVMQMGKMDYDKTKELFLFLQPSYSNNSNCQEQKEGLYISNVGQV